MSALVIFRRELWSYFVTPIGWLVATLFALVQGFSFYLIVELSAESDAVFGSPMTLFFGGTYLYWLFLIAVCAVLSMRLIAEERRSGALELLLTSGVSSLQVVLGKLAAALAFYAAIWLPTLFYVAILQLVGGSLWLDPGVVLAGYLGTLLFGLTALSIGLLCSAATRSQLAAGLSTFVALSMLLLAGPSGLFSQGDWSVLAEYFDWFAQMERFARGIIDGRALALHLGISLFVIFAASAVLERQKWRR
ncbi:MAG: ABC transporter permease [Deltaproteobacteria bacterium]|nr:ABC transporter permease [Deltaproteobacteria bacterium]